MAIELASTGTGHPTRQGNVKVPYLIEAEIDLAVAATTKGSALAQGDVIEALRIPIDSVVLYANVEVKAVMTGTSTDCTIDVGDTGGTVDRYVNGLDLDAASAGDYGPDLAGQVDPLLASAADTIDILIATQTGTVTGGTIRVFAVVIDVSDASAPGLAALGS